MEAVASTESVCYIRFVSFAVAAQIEFRDTI